MRVTVWLLLAGSLAGMRAVLGLHGGEVSADEPQRVASPGAGISHVAEDRRASRTSWIVRLDPTSDTDETSHPLPVRKQPTAALPSSARSSITASTPASTPAPNARPVTSGRQGSSGSKAAISTNGPTSSSTTIRVSLDRPAPEPGDQPISVRRNSPSTAIDGELTPIRQHDELPRLISPQDDAAQRDAGLSSHSLPSHVADGELTDAAIDAHVEFGPFPSSSPRPETSPRHSFQTIGLQAPERAVAAEGVGFSPGGLSWFATQTLSSETTLVAAAAVVLLWFVFGRRRVPALGMVVQFAGEGAGPRNDSVMPDTPRETPATAPTLRSATAHSPLRTEAVSALTSACATPAAPALHQPHIAQQSPLHPTAEALPKLSRMQFPASLGRLLAGTFADDHSVEPQTTRDRERTASREPVHRDLLNRLATQAAAGSLNADLDLASTEPLAPPKPHAQPVSSPVEQTLCDKRPVAPAAAADRVTRMVQTLGPAAEEVVPLLQQVLGHSVAQLRRKATASLQQVGRKTVPALIQALHNEDLEVRHMAIVALGDMIQSVIPALLESLQSDDPEVRRQSIAALVQAGPGPALVVSTRSTSTSAPTAMPTSAANGAAVPGLASQRNDAAVAVGNSAPLSGARLLYEEREALLLSWRGLPA